MLRYSTKLVLGENRHASVNWHSENPLSKSEGIPRTRYTIFLFSFWNFDDINYAAIKCLKTALVVDPVMVSTSGHTLAGPSILESFRYVTLRVIVSFHVLRVNSYVDLLTNNLLLLNFLLPYSWNIQQALNFLYGHAIYGQLSHAWIKHDHHFCDKSWSTINETSLIYVPM